MNRLVGFYAQTGDEHVRYTLDMEARRDTEAQAGATPLDTQYPQESDASALPEKFFEFTLL
jgi:hypothetical protein